MTEKPHLVLLGDSIFDNGPYVDPGESVSEILTDLIQGEALVTLLAVDGDTTQDVKTQLKTFPEDATHVFLSCGGNDGLQQSAILQFPALSVEGALEALHTLREEFRENYRTMLKDILALCDQTAVCTIYNKVPGITEAEETALALYNEVILEEAFAQGLPVIDLRLVCDDPGDYSARSPIEPSEQGARKIADVIYHVIDKHDFSKKASVYYE